MRAILIFFSVLSGIGSLFMGGNREIAQWRKKEGVPNPVIFSGAGSWGLLAVVIHAGFPLHWPSLVLAVICLALIVWGVMAARTQLDKAEIPFQPLQTLGAAMVSGSLMVLILLTAISGFVGFVR